MGGNFGSTLLAEARRPSRRGRARHLLLIGLILVMALAGASCSGEAQTLKRQRAIPLPVPNRIVPTPALPAPDGGTVGVAALQPESVQADVSTRNVQVTSSFAGTEIVVFGAVNNSRQQSAEAGLYDIVIVVVGTPTKLVARRKDRVAGIWLNTDALAFDSVPSYYAIASTRPIDEVTSSEVLKATGIGFDYVPMELAKGAEKRSAAEIKEFREAIVRLKLRERLYAKGEFAVTFIGPSLFRASIEVPANVVVGPFETRVYLFRNGELLSQFNARLDLERQGLEEAMHVLAFKHPILYGLVMVALAMGAGMLAAAVFRSAGR
ncbi:MAG: TIGR02186 family protein [Hyphomicrobiaceae bacterium]|nr:TIGR02186 family protein [Hyphomicrobiaceae bacterium]